MAASSLNVIRVRLFFDYPPPGVSECRMCWVLVDLNKCRVVADLASVIREKFDFSRRTILDLFIEDCYLPPTESVYVVRDNDSIRVKVENQPLANGVKTNSKCEGLSQKASKRIREGEDENEGFKMRKKKKKTQPESQEAQPVRDTEKKKKRTKLKEKNSPVKPAAPAKQTTPVKQPTVSKSTPHKSAKKPTAPAASAARKAAKKSATSSSETSDSSEEESPKKPVKGVAPSRPSGGITGPAKPINTTKPANAAKPAKPGNAAKPANTVKAANAAKAAASYTSESSSDSGPSPRATRPVPKKPTVPAVKTVPAKPQSSSTDSDSDSPSERPGLGHQAPPPAAGPSGSLPLDGVPRRGGANPRGVGRGGSPGAGRGMGRGNGRVPWRGGSPRGGQRGGLGRAGRGAGNHVFYSYSDQNGLQPPPSDDTLTNKTVVLQNPPESAPKPDYESMPLLAAPPPVGQKIAFKLLELTENYTPEVSDYKEGKIIRIDQATNQVELELLSCAPAPAEPGKFDLVYQSPDGSEIVEYAVTRASQQLTERWDSLLQPRLILENSA